MKHIAKLIVAFAIVAVASNLFMKWAGEMAFLFPADPTFAVLGMFTSILFVVVIVGMLVDSALSDIFIVGQKAGQDIMFKEQMLKQTEESFLP